MKKILSLMLAAVCCFSLGACSGGGGQTPPDIGEEEQPSGPIELTSVYQGAEIDLCDPSLREYLEEEDMDDKDRKRWESCYNKYTELRDALSKKTVYNRKMYGLFVDYNALQQMNDNGNFMNTYY